MKKRLLVISSCTLFLCVIIVAVTGLNSKKADAPSENRAAPVNANPVQPTPESEFKSSEQVTKSGTFGCLSHKDTSGPQTMECAFGLTTDDGTIYALRADNPMLIGTIPTNQRVEVTGKLMEQVSKYQSAGTINVDTVKQL